MGRRSDGQSMVEMALLLPLLVLVIFGIIDLGYYIYGYASIYQAARNGVEKAAEIPPWPSKVAPLRAAPDRSDVCVDTILNETMAVAGQFTDLTTSPNSVEIRYPSVDSSGKPLRALKEPIEINIVYQLRPLTPLWRFVTFGTQGTMTIRTTARRSVEALGNNPTALNLVACQPGPGES